MLFPFRVFEINLDPDGQIETAENKTRKSKIKGKKLKRTSWMCNDKCMTEWY